MKAIGKRAENKKFKMGAEKWKVEEREGRGEELLKVGRQRDRFEGG
jgi:hypothetical protein